MSNLIRYCIARVNASPPQASRQDAYSQLSGADIICENVLFYVWHMAGDRTKRSQLQ